MGFNGDNASKEKLKKLVDKEITKMFTSVLDFAEVAIDSPQRFKNLRSKILRVSNEAIRDIAKEIDQRYIIKYDPPAEDIIVVRNKK